MSAHEDRKLRHTLADSEARREVQYEAKATYFSNQNFLNSNELKKYKT